MAIDLLMDHFADLPDPREASGRRHVLTDLLAIALSAAICGAEGWTHVAEFGRSKRDWFKTFLSLPHGIPSHDTFGRVFALLDPAAMEQCFMRWTQALSEQSGNVLINLDGKSLRKSFAHAWDPSGMVHLVSAFVGVNRLVLGQVATDPGGDEPRGNEITAIDKLLDLLDISGATVSIDAIGCQRDIARKIVDKGGHYVLCVKDNQPTLHETVKRLLDEAIADGQMPLGRFEQTDGDHGRIEIRRVWCTSEVEHLKLPEPWPYLRSIACVERVRDLGGNQVSTERHYYIASLLDPGAQAFAEAIRGHWSIENQLHWHLDVSFGEDDCRVRSGHAAENLSRIRRIALNQLQRETTLKGGIKTKRLKAGWDHSYLLKVLSA